MNSKSVIVIFVCFSIIFSACSTQEAGRSNPDNDNSSSEPIVVKAWFHQYGEEEAHDFLNNWTEEFNKSQDKIKLETTIVPGGVEDYYKKLTTAFTSGEGPELFEMDAADFYKYHESGIAAPLNNLVTSEIKEDFDEDILSYYTIDGKLYGIPFIVDAIGLYYDKDVLEAANIQPPTTWDELRKTAKKLTTKDRKGLVITPLPGGYQNYEFWPFLWAAGGDVLDKSGNESIFDSEATRQALQLYRDLMNDESIYSSLQTEGQDINYLLNGQAAMQLSGIWATPRVEASGKNIGLVPYPAVDENGMQMSVIGGWNMLVNSNSENIDAAKEVIKWFWLDGTERMGQFNTVGGFHLAPRKSVIEANSDVYSKPLYKEWVEDVIPLGRKSLFLPPEIATIVNDAIQTTLFNEKISIDQIVEGANRRIQNVLKINKNYE